jgi:hypothetical protein
MYYSGNLAPGIGTFLSALRVYLLAQGWVSLGTIAVNHEVFKSTGESTTENIIIAINDSVSGSAYFRAATAYDDVTKVLSNPTTARYIQLSTTYAMPYWFFVKKDYFVTALKNYSVYPYALVYCGLLNRYDPTDAYCIICAGATSAAGVPLAVAHGYTFAGGGQQLLQDHAGLYNRTLDAVALNACFGVSQLPNPVDGKLIISPILVGKTISDIQGEMFDVYSCQQAEIASEDILVKGADEYLCFILSTYKCAVKK